MVKTCLAILLFGVSSISYGQIKRNAVLLGGQLSYYNDKNRSDSFIQNFESGRIGISAGKAIRENTVVGINFTTYSGQTGI